MNCPPPHPLCLQTDLNGLYGEQAERVDNYHRDMNVFSKDVAIEDDSAFIPLSSSTDLATDADHLYGLLCSVGAGQVRVGSHHDLPPDVLQPMGGHAGHVQWVRSPVSIPSHYLV